jgi:transcriptional regulator with XRE-family HTH domain
MKKYYTLGELLTDYRIHSNISQLDFAARLGVDPRSVQRWEKDHTLIKPEKEEDLVIETLFPYQLVRNLNAPVPIPTHYDFIIRKYALNDIDCETPDAEFFKDQLYRDTDRIRTIIFDQDFTYLQRYLEIYKPLPNNLIKVIQESIDTLPEINNIIIDESGYYAGHSLVFSISRKAYEKIKTRKMTEFDLTTEDLVDYKKQKKPIFYALDVSADCNANWYLIVNRLIRFLENLPDQNYLFCGCPFRLDSIALIKQAGLEIIWEGETQVNNLGDRYRTRFQEGSFHNFMNK